MSKVGGMHVPDLNFKLFHIPTLKDLHFAVQISIQILSLVVISSGFTSLLQHCVACQTGSPYAQPTVQKMSWD